MPEEEKVKEEKKVEEEKDIKKESMVDIDTSGPGADVELPEEKITEVEEQPETEDKKDEKTSEDVAEPDDTSKQSDIKPDVQTGQQKEEIEQYGEGVKRRIAKLTKNWREEERQKNAALDYAKSVLTEQKDLKERLTRLDSTYTSELETRIKKGFEGAKAKLSKAIEASDVDAQVLAQRDIAQLAIDEAKLADAKERQERAKIVKEEASKTRMPANVGGPIEQPMPMDPQARQWAEKNTWFGKDEPMTYTALSYHKKMVDEEGYDPYSTDYYQEIDKRIKVAFPQKFGNKEVQTESSKPTQIVGSATRSAKKGRNIQRLTSSEVAIARKLGVPLEDYAKQKLNMTKEV